MGMLADICNWLTGAVWDVALLRGWPQLALMDHIWLDKASMQSWALLLLLAEKEVMHKACYTA